MSRSRVLPVAVDVSLAVVAAVIGSLLALADPNLDTRHVAAPTWVFVAAQAGAAAMLLVRRRHPYTAALTIAAVSLFAPAWAAFLVPYAVTAYGAGRRSRQWTAIGLLAVAFLVGMQAWEVDDPFTSPAIIFVSGLLGMYFNARRSLVAELTDRAERAERERLLLAEQARADERIRLAGEMHDVVTHRINLMVLQAGALRVSSTDPAARTAAEELRVAGCQALAELRDLVGVLRTGDGTPTSSADPATAPGLESLVDDSRAVGLPVELAEDGDPDVVAPTVRRTLFRVVQESLTNVHKHAPGADATVSVHYGRENVRAVVSNTPPRRTPDADLTAAGGGSGLAGLRHRVEVVGGSLTAGSTSDGGFTVKATLPLYVPTAARR
ncbi:sensor histidine kinase [Virgisporangium ochraceum]|uniref:histidine kinase n=1 Tax=Virgisporangium ochraceum TaxID=65505 RepID=A0A8J4A570_9ACTN|nr:histidine kinase [Virgisporangium ochraceum]GIJ73595.1 two-component sensor histidine kinase [Virgisporangium ochraceum]